MYQKTIKMIHVKKMLQKCNKPLYKNKNKIMTILTQKQAKKLGRSNTIDLKGMIAKEYLDSKKTNMDKFKESAIKIIAVAGIFYYVVALFFGWGIFVPNEANASNQDLVNRENARLSRLIQCNNQIDLVKNYIHTNQDIGTRCATIRTLSQDYSPISNIMEGINTNSKAENYWEIYYDIKRIRIKNGISVNTTGSKPAITGTKISYDMIKNETGVNIPYKLFEGLRNECSVQNAKNQFHCIKTGLSIAYAESSWKDLYTPFGLQSKDKSVKKWVKSYNKYWYTAKNGFFFYGDWGQYGRSHYCTDEESSGSKKGCPNGRKNFNKVYYSLSLK